MIINLKDHLTPLLELRKIQANILFNMIQSKISSII